MMPKSCRICSTGLPLRLNSAATSSYCRSSIRLRSLINDNSGLWTSSGMFSQKLKSPKGKGHRLKRAARLFPVPADKHDPAFARDCYPCSWCSLTLTLRHASGIHADCLGQFEFLQLGLNADGILRLGDNFFTGDHAGKIFINQETVQRYHAVFSAGLNIGLDAEGLVVANERCNRGRIDHDLENRDTSRF